MGSDGGSDGTWVWAGNVNFLKNYLIADGEIDTNADMTSGRDVIEKRPMAVDEFA
ncbi:hypothetical protein M413DRAFT_443199 [Hebeloma cylindrosporum]|uniref:Uncharacterized protein n=1 Tax=Hebeloma cylindrosporum TaxID=76867 RepID=A0A0C3C5P3_HEBCY|nr:hypothetical protein M413DRAFT_443199 [Hebeloma cylindrosporum h7]